MNVDWDEFKIKDLDISLIDGDRGKNYPKKSEFQNEGYCLFLNTGNVTARGFEFSNVSFISKEKDSLLRKGKLVVGDIVLTTRGTVGNVAYFSDSTPYDNIRINSGMLIIRANNRFSKSYLYHFFKSPLFTEQVKSFQYGAAQPQLPIGTLNHIKIVVPPLPTQRKIAAILSAYDDLIENNLKRIKLLEEKAQLTYEEWFVRLKFPNYQNTPTNPETGLPEGWGKVRLKELVSLQQGFAVNKKSNHHISESKTKFPLLKISDLLNETETLFVKETIPKQFLVDEHEIIYSRTGQVGYAFMGRKGVVYNNCFRVTPNDKINSELLHQILISKPIKELAQTLATGTAQPDLNHGAFKSIQVTLPPKTIQKVYFDSVKNIKPTIKGLKRQNQLLKESRDILLPRLMTGIIDVDKLDVSPDKILTEL